MKINQRRCISCRRVADRSEFWRVVRLYDTGEVRLDQGMGRSAYLCATLECLQSAQRKKRIERALRVPVHRHIYETLWTRLENPSLSSR